MLGHPRGGRGVEEVGAVLQQPGQPVPVRDELDAQVEGRRAAGHGDGAGRHAPQGGGRGRGGVEQDHDVEERVAARFPYRPRGFHDPLEGGVVVGEGIEDGGGGDVQQLAVGACGVDGSAQHDRVDEEADRALQFGASAPGGQRPDGDVVLSRPAGEQCLAGGDQRGEQRGVLLCRHLPQPGRRGRRDAELVDRAVAGLLAAAGAVERQLQRHGPVQLLGPVGELLLQQGAGQPFALPYGEVRVLRGRRGGRGRLAVGQGVVARAQFVQQHAHGPAVGDDVVRGEQQDVLVVGHADQQGPQQRTGAQVERAGVLRQQQVVQRVRAGSGPLPRVGCGALSCPQVAYRQRYGGGRVHGLDGASVDVVEGGPQRLVAGRRGVERPGQRGPVQGAGQPQGDRAVVAGVAGPELVEEPQPLLGEGERQGL